MSDMFFKTLYRVLLRRATRCAIVDRNKCLNSAEQGKFTRAELGQMLQTLWAHYDELAPDIPQEPTLGAKHNVRFACVALCLHKVLRERGVDDRYAMTLVNDSLWLIYKWAASVPRLIARILSRDPKKRIWICVRIFTLFPFNRPGYEYEVIPDDAPETAIAIKWTRCVTIDYLRKHGAEALCLECLCNLDYPLLEYWGGSFDRPCLQAVEGADYCHMRFNIRP